MHATNGTAVSVEIRSIHVGERCRQDYGNLDALMASMKDDGLFHAIGITKSGNLIYGARRFEAASRLGWTAIQARVFDVDNIQSFDLEQKENDLRKDLTWTEKLALAEVIKDAIGDQRRYNGKPRDEQGSIQNNYSESKSEQTRDTAARKSGMGSHTTMRHVKTAKEKGVAEVVEALDADRIAPYVAAKIAALPQDSQSGVLEQILNGRNAEQTIAEAKPKSDKPKPAAPAHVPDQLRDGLGKPVPDLQKDAFGDPVIPKFIEQLEDWSSSLAWQPILKGLEARQHMFPALMRQLAVFGQSMQQAEDGLKIALDVLRNTRPYAVCPSCKGVGKDEDGPCAECESAGHLTQCRHEELWGKAEAV